jgi:hypothetical protein
MIVYTYSMGQSKITSEHRAFLDELAGLWPLAKGSLAEVRKPCIRSNCPACRSGRKHPAWLFSFSQGGRRRCRYVPLDLVATLRQALDNGRQLERRLVELGAEWLQRVRQERA